MFVKKGVCNLSIVPIRKSPADESEMISQLLFGESFDVIGQENQWRQVRCHLDGYEGWIDEKQMMSVSDLFLEKISSQKSYSLEIAQSAISPEHHIPLVLGSTLPLYDGMNFRLEKEKYIFSGQAYSPDIHNQKAVILEKIALKYINAPYLWGGRSPFGIDCSGLIQTVFKILGFPLLRDTYQQAEQGRTVDFIDAAQPGDIAFFPNKAGKIAHVGIIMSDMRIIHAYGRTRMDKIDHFGIFNEETKKYTHKLQVIKRIL